MKLALGRAAFTCFIGLGALLGGCGGGGSSGLTACITGLSCVPEQACRTGRTVCVEAGVACAAAEASPDGTACDGGACKGGVCSTAAACVAGQACQPQNACTTGLTTCASAVAEPTCAVAQNKADGTACGTGQVCSGGACVASTCVAGTACQPANACSEGLIACASSTTPGTCLATAARADGTSCGSGLVCGGGVCVAQCTAGSTCALSNPCAVGATTCDSAWSAARCTSVAYRPDGTACGTGQTCRQGSCVVQDTTPPHVLARTPAPGATNVWSRDPITVRFDKRMNHASFTEGSVILATGAGTPVAKTMTLSTDGLTLTITPLALPDPPLALTVALTSGITDTAGNALVAPAGSWRWDLPAWQRLGAVPRETEIHGGVDSYVALGPDGTPIAAFHSISEAGTDRLGVFGWRGGWGSNLLPLDEMRYYAGVSIDVSGSGQPLVAWIDRGGYLAIPGIMAARWSAGSRSANEIIGGGIGRRVVARFDRNDRPVVAWASERDASCYLHVARYENGWRLLGGSAVTSTCWPWRLSFTPGGEPQVAWDMGPNAYDPLWRSIGMATWSGSTWIRASVAATSVPPPLPSRLI